MKLLILSDLHVEFEKFKLPKGLDFDVAILAGDILAPGHLAPGWARRPMLFPDKPVVMVAGNHEFYGTTMEQELGAMREQARGSGVHFLEGDEVVIGGIRFLGCTLWTDFALRIDWPGFPGQRSRMLSDRDRSMSAAAGMLNDYSAIQVEDSQTSNTLGARRLKPMDTLLIHRRQRAWLRRKLGEPFDGTTVVVTHHAPHIGSLAKRFAGDWSSGAFVSEMPEVFFEVPQLWVHGHTHTSFDYQVGHCRVLCNPRGYVSWKGDIENRQFDPGLVVEV